MKFFGAVLLMFAGTVSAYDGGFYFPDEVETYTRPNGEIHYRPLNSRPPNQHEDESQKPSAILATVEQLLPLYWRNHVNEIISSGVLKFTLDMDRAISELSDSDKKSTENVIFSPLSIAGTMATVLLASRGRTFAESAKILGLHRGVDMMQHSEIVHELFGLLMEQINERKSSGEPVLDYSNGIFVQEGFPIRPEFKKMSEEVYKSEVMNLDFKHQPFQSQAAVNNWVERKTKGMIKDILEGPPSSSTKVILASALYFHGLWKNFFLESDTARSTFMLERDQRIDVDMMYNTGDYPFYVDDKLGAKIIGLPYNGDKVTMYVILPHVVGAKHLKQFKKSLTSETVERMIEQMELSDCEIALPRMNLSSTLSLQDALSSIGLKSLFQPGVADLSLLSPGQQESRQIKRNSNRRTVNDKSQSFPTFGLDDLRNSPLVNPQLYADEVVHKVEIKINEKGTEAAAATAVLANRNIGSEFFYANRPFIFFIRHDPSKLILFWGTVNKPEPNY